MVKTEGPLDWK